MSNEEHKPTFWREHSDACAVIVVIIGAALWMQTGLHGLDKRLATIENTKIAQKLEDVNTRLTVIETCMLCNKTMPSHVSCVAE